MPGRRTVETSYHGRITINEENAAAALEVMSRFAVDPRWLLYLPPTMSPVYGPDYTEPANLDRLRQRGLGHKRSLAAREYALGLEALDRAARGEPLWRVHSCVFAVLALESEPVDPRL